MRFLPRSARVDAKGYQVVEIATFDAGAEMKLCVCLRKERLHSRTGGEMFIVQACAQQKINKVRQF